MSSTPMLDVAIQAAKAAGALIREAMGDGIVPPRLDAKNKGAIDLVTQVDLAAEEAIARILAATGIPLLAEERGGAMGDTRWIVDPLDGTTNFVHGFPSFCTSIALQEAGAVTVGCVYDPIRDHLYTAVRGGGAFCNGVRLAVSPTDDLGRALLLTGFPYDRQKNAAYYLRFVQHFLERTQGIRRAGAAALDLCHVAAGRAEGFWEFGLAPWDVAAGALLVEEAGGRVTDMEGGPLDLARPRLLATNGRVHEPMAQALAGLLSS